MVVEKQHSLLESGSFWNRAVLSLNLQLYILLIWRHWWSYIFFPNISFFLIDMRVMICSQKFLCKAERQCLESTNWQRTDSTYLVSGDCYCWGFGFHSIVIWALLLLVPDVPYCFSPLFLEDTACGFSETHFFWSYQNFKLITKKSLARIKHYKSKDKWLFISLFSLSIDFFISLSLM